MIFALHYFLWFSALTPVYGYLSVYAKNYANVSSRDFGILNMVLPFVAIITKPVFCSLADRHRAYRRYFISFLILATIGWGSFGILPFFIEQPNPDEGIIVRNWIIICVMTLLANLSMSVISCLSDAFAVNQARKNNTLYGRIRVWGTIGWGFSALVIAYINEWDKLPKLVPGLLYTIVFLVLDVISVASWRNKSDFKLDKPIADIDDEDQDLPIQSASSLDLHAASLSTKTFSPDEQRDISDNPTVVDITGQPQIEANNQRVNNGANKQIEARISVPPDLLLRTLSSPSSFQDNLAKGNLDKNLSSLQATNNIILNSTPLQQSAYGAINNNNNNNTQLVKDISTQSSQNEIKVISLRLQLTMLGMVINSRRSLIRYMILFTMSGALISMQWSYFFLYLEEIYPADFTYISGLSMVGQSMLGELPFFIISQKIINIIGRSHTLSLSIASIGIRYLLYVYLLPNASMYFVILVEALQGPNFSLFYVVMTEVGMDYSNCEDVIMKLVVSQQIENNPSEIQQTRRALRATMQGLVSACYEGLGVGIGSVIGGSIIYSYGFKYLWIGSTTTALSVGLINFLIDIYCDRPRITRL